MHASDRIGLDLETEQRTPRNHAVSIAMSSTYFRVTEHTISCQHIREYPHATANTQEDELRLAIKQYTPLDNLIPQPGDLTVIAAHANGFPKVSSIIFMFWLMHGTLTGGAAGDVRASVGRHLLENKRQWRRASNSIHLDR